MRKSGILGWFKWETKKQREKREKAYTQMMFPLGPEERDWEIAMIKELFPEVKKNTQELHYALLTLRESLYCTQLDEEDEDYMTLDEALHDWDSSDITKSLGKRGYYPYLKAMGFLENAATSFEELPTADEIRQEAEKYKVK